MGGGSRPRSVFLCLTNIYVNIRQLSSSTEAEVDIILPSVGHPLSNLIARESTSSQFMSGAIVLTFTVSTFVESFLKTLFIVSDVSVMNDSSLGMSSSAWVHVDSVQLPGEMAVPPL